MDILLDEVEVRTLGCLIEKELTTPEYYPLSLNSLTNACNQKSNRSPVVYFDEADVAKGLEGLQEKGLARKTLTAGSRVTKYLHTILDKFDLSRQEIAILCELMLRGPQTMGEVRTRAERMSPFDSLEEVERKLQALMDFDPALVIKLPREAGRKECRHMHLFSGIPAHALSEVSTEQAPPQLTVQERLSRLEEENSRLRSELEQLRQAFAEFRSQF
ncbi:MAG: YceH family protein [Thermodesulfovibrionales bacterium]